jgi:Cu/Ag efflux protein CusF
MKSVLIAAAVVFVSTTGAFAQMSHDGNHGGEPMTASPMVEGVGTINGVDMDKRTVNVSHEPIGALGWPSMTMDFTVAEGVDMSALAKGEAIAFSLSRGSDGIYMIDALKDR